MAISEMRVPNAENKEGRGVFKENNYRNSAGCTTLS